MFCRETMLVFLEGCSVKIGGPNKTVEIDESKRLVLGFFFLQNNVPRKVRILGNAFLEKVPRKVRVLGNAFLEKVPRKVRVLGNAFFRKTYPERLGF
jgi:hypothetical protein